MIEDYEHMQETINIASQDYTLGLRSVQGWELVTVFKPTKDMVQFFWKRPKLYSSNYLQIEFRQRAEDEYIKIHEKKIQTYNGKGQSKDV